MSFKFSCLRCANMDVDEMDFDRKDYGPDDSGECTAMTCKKCGVKRYYISIAAWDKSSEILWDRRNG